MLCFLETDIREQKKYEKRIQTSIDKTVNDMCYEIKFENRVKDKNNSEVDTKKHRYVSAKASNAALVKLTD